MFARAACVLGIGIALGAGGAALFEPRRGAARRAMLRSWTRARARNLTAAARGKARDVGARARGALHEAKARAAERDVSDDILVERVRAQIGRPVSHPRALQVFAKDGCVELRGNVFEGEVRGLLSRVRSVRGVKDVIAHLDVHATPDAPAPLPGR
jgi:hypothetical protein